MEPENPLFYRSFGTGEKRDSSGILSSFSYDSLGSSCENCKHWFQLHEKLANSLVLNVPNSKSSITQPRFQGRAITKKTLVTQASPQSQVFSPAHLRDQVLWGAPPQKVEAIRQAQHGRIQQYSSVIGEGRNDHLGPRNFGFTAPRRECRFCKSNGEPLNKYNSHVLRNSEGKLICPILRKHICEVCGATGDQAHTRNYCPNRPVQVAVTKKIGRKLTDL